jgi:hypothetical protein
VLPSLPPHDFCEALTDWGLGYNAPQVGL